MLCQGLAPAKSTIAGPVHGVALAHPQGLFSPDPGLCLILKAFRHTEQCSRNWTSQEPVLRLLRTASTASAQATATQSPQSIVLVPEAGRTPIRGDWCFQVLRCQCVGLGLLCPIMPGWVDLPLIPIQGIHTLLSTTPSTTFRFSQKHLQEHEQIRCIWELHVCTSVPSIMVICRRQDTSQIIAALVW